MLGAWTRTPTCWSGWWRTASRARTRRPRGGAWSLPAGAQPSRRGDGSAATVCVRVSVPPSSRSGKPSRATAPRGSKRARDPAVAESGLAVALVRRARAVDAGCIAAIWNVEVQTALTITHTEPRSLEAQRAWLAGHDEAHPVVVAVSEMDDRDVLGYGALSPYRPGAAFRGAVEDSVYVRRDARGHRVGALLLAHLLERARTAEHRTVLARIVSDNVASIRLHEGQGFERVGLERRTALKFGRYLDVVLLQRLL
jgi:L-amino acid N-acyltransferase